MSRSITTNTDFAEINKVRFFCVGTALYSSLTILLHPASVIKVRQQVLGRDGTGQITLKGFVSNMKSLKGVRNLYRGLGVVLFLAVPARVVYVTTLEGTKQRLMTGLNSLPVGQSAVATTISAGFAGGLAAVAAQLMAVPMDIISQRQMVAQSNSTPSAVSVVKKAIASEEGILGLYRGFSISLIASLPTGTIWWATYAACQDQFKLQQPEVDYDKPLRENENAESFSLHSKIQWLGIQLYSGVTAAIVSASLSQPLDVVKTRLQVLLPSDVGLTKTAKSSETAISYSSVVKALWKKEGLLGFYRGLGPRMIHMSLWGTVLASAYEYLKYISRHPEGISVHLDDEEIVSRNAQLARRLTRVTIQSNMH